mmetsp:Transcript_13013/g.28163  ORF Transcript_13013/g.28163 Transcript_13013/m.28163 type:complete len:692 (-) Transcript_13013:51-2126(-)
MKRRHAGTGTTTSTCSSDGSSIAPSSSLPIDGENDTGVVVPIAANGTEDDTAKEKAVRKTFTTSPSPSSIGRLCIAFTALLFATCLVDVLFVGDGGGIRPAGAIHGISNGKVMGSVAAGDLADVPISTGEKKKDLGKEEKPKTSFPSADFFDTVKTMRTKFETRYGGADAAYAMLARGIRSFPDDKNYDKAIQHTASRFLRSAASSDPKFVASFGGYSVTVGRGNLFSQSFPFVMESVLREPLKEIGVDLVVRNAAIGGIPSFPYGWCLPNFLGEDSDLVSWDYSMNEGNDVNGLEAYVRHALAMLPKRPLLVLLDNKRARMDLIKKYVKLGALIDPVAIIRGDNVVDKGILSKKEVDRPEGFTRWDEWGAPKGSPGQSSWHPKFREHEMMGWMLAIHLLDAVEVAGRIMTEELDWREKYAVSSQGEQEQFKLRLPPPQVKTSSELSVLYGAETSDGSWYMNPVSCRTSFLPVVSDSLSLSSIVVSGAVEDDSDAMKSKGDEMYGKGWVIDVGKVERDTKRKVEKSGGMGYIDMKLALYGIPDSGPIRFWIPYEGTEADVTSAKTYFNTIIVCEVNEKRGDRECKMDSDVTFSIGGVQSHGVKKIKSVASYLRKEICVMVAIPDGAEITIRKDVTEAEEGLHGNIHERGHEDDIGVFLDAEIINKSISRKDGACSISHVIWEQQSPPKRIA